MPDANKQTGRSDSDDLRQKAYQVEAEAVRRDMLTYLQSGLQNGSAMQEFQGKLSAMIEQALSKVVNEALQDPKILAIIRGQVAEVVIEGIKQEVVNRQTEIVGHVKGKLLSVWQKEVEEVLLQSRALPQERVSRPSIPEEPNRAEQGRTKISEVEPPKNSADRPEQGKVPGIPPQGSGSQTGPREAGSKEPGPLSRWLRVPWVAPAVFGLGGVLIIALVLIVGSSQEPRRRGAPFKETSPVEARTDRAIAEPVSQEEVFIHTMRIIDAGLPANDPLVEAIRQRPYSNQFRCWFDTDAQLQLDYLVKNRKLDAGVFEDTLRDTYNPCVQKDYQLGVSNLPVFAAQGMVHYFLLEQQKKGWEMCAGKIAPVGLPDLKKFRSDGEVGPSTYSLLNAFLACTGRSSPQISQASSVAEYLFLTYAAVKELEEK